MSVVALLLVNYKEEWSPFIPAALCCTTNRLVLAFQPKTRAYRALYATVSLLLLLKIDFGISLRWLYCILVKNDSGREFSTEYFYI